MVKVLPRGITNLLAQPEVRTALWAARESPETRTVHVVELEAGRAARNVDVILSPVPSSSTAAW